MTLFAPQYPHVATRTDIAPLNGDGVEAAYVSATTKLGESQTEVVVYWQDDEDGTPRLIVDVLGAGVDNVRVNVNEALVYEGKPEPVKCPVCAEEGYATSEECTFCEDSRQS